MQILVSIITFVLTSWKICELCVIVQADSSDIENSMLRRRILTNNQDEEKRYDALDILSTFKHVRELKKGREGKKEQKKKKGEEQDEGKRQKKEQEQVEEVVEEVEEYIEEAVEEGDDGYYIYDDDDDDDDEADYYEDDEAMDDAAEAENETEEDDIADVDDVANVEAEVDDSADDTVEGYYLYIDDLIQTTTYTTGTNTTSIKEFQTGLTNTINENLPEGYDVTEDEVMYFIIGGVASFVILSAYFLTRRTNKEDDDYVRSDLLKNENGYTA